MGPFVSKQASRARALLRNRVRASFLVVMMAVTAFFGTVIYYGVHFTTISSVSHNQVIYCGVPPRNGTSPGLNITCSLANFDSGVAYLLGTKGERAAVLVFDIHYLGNTTSKGVLFTGWIDPVNYTTSVITHSTFHYRFAEPGTPTGYCEYQGRCSGIPRVLIPEENCLPYYLSEHGTCPGIATDVGVPGPTNPTTLDLERQGGPWIYSVVVYPNRTSTLNFSVQFSFQVRFNAGDINPFDPIRLLNGNISVPFSVKPDSKVSMGQCLVRFEAVSYNTCSGKVIRFGGNTT